MRVCLLRLIFGAVVLGLTVSTAYAQSGTPRTTLSGTVLDSGGGLLPGATNQDPNVTFDPGGRVMQLVFRFNF